MNLTFPSISDALVNLNINKVIANFTGSSMTPILESSLPALTGLGVVLGTISGYEIGHTLVLKAKGMWHPSLVKPVVLLVATVAIALLTSPAAATAIGVATATSFIFGAAIAFFEKDFNFEEEFNKPYFGVEFWSPEKFLAEFPPNNSFDKFKNVALKHLMWGLAYDAYKKERPFTKGTYVIEGELGQNLYNKLLTIPGCYDRHSSHYAGRSTSGQFGIDASVQGFGGLIVPFFGGTQTILFGMIDNHDDTKSLFIKPENWGADHRPSQLFTSWTKMKHFANHTFEFIHAQYVKIIRPGYDDQPGMAKERIPSAWKKHVSKIDHFGWANLSTADKQKLIDNGLAKPEWMKDTYRTGNEDYR